MFIIGQILFPVLLIFLVFIEGVIVAALILVFVSGLISHFYGAPYVPVKKKAIKDILLFGGLSLNDNFYDLGSGDGRVLISAVRDFGVQKAAGYEISLWPYLKARLLLRRAGLKDRIKIFRRNFFKADLSAATFVYLYLFPKLVDRLAYKLARECRSGAKILCLSFPIDITRHSQFRLLKSEKIGKMMAYLHEKI
jgi:hypothetical protein